MRWKFARLFTGAKNEVQIFHIKSQANNLTLREILFCAVIFALQLTMRPKKRRQSWLLQAKQRRRDDRTATLSQIVHLTLRRMFDPGANFDK